MSSLVISNTDRRLTFDGLQRVYEALADIGVKEEVFHLFVESEQFDQLLSDPSALFRSSQQDPDYPKDAFYSYTPIGRVFVSRLHPTEYRKTHIDGDQRE